MKLLLLLPIASFLLQAQTDSPAAAYKAWDLQHRESDYNAREQSLLQVSADWVAKWPDSREAWRWRRESLVGTRSRSAELWKQVNENLIRLSPPHTFAASAAADWIGVNVNVEDAEALIASEIDWIETEMHHERPPKPALAEQIHEAQSVLRVLGMLGTLATAQIQLKQFDGAHVILSRIHTVLDVDFKRYYDQDPVEAFPDYQSRYFSLSAQLAEAEGRNVDALAMYQQIITNPYYRRMSSGSVNHTHALCKQVGGSDEGWVTFSTLLELPPNVPGEHIGIPFQPWEIVEYKLPDFNAPSFDSRTWTTRDFEGKTTLMYLWASWCGPCRPHLPVVQAVYNAIKRKHHMNPTIPSAECST